MGNSNLKRAIYTKIKTWDGSDFKRTILYLGCIWNHQRGLFIVQTNYNFNEIRIELHTGGQTENERIITALSESPFWKRYWRKSKQGRHHYFAVPMAKV